MGMSLKTKYSVGTVIVAADGSGDFTDIQDAIDSLPSTGGVVYVKEGTYNVTSAIEIINKNNVSLFGAGSATVINFSNNSNILINGSTGCYIKDLSLVSLDSGDSGVYIVSSNEITFRRLSISGFSNGVEFPYAGGGCSDCQITECIIFATSCGIYHRYGDDTIITGNNINNASTGIYTGPQGYLVLITSNVINNVTIGVNSDQGCGIINSNQIYASSVGIQATSIWGIAAYSEISNNNIEVDGDDYGIFLRNIYSIGVHNNIVNGNGWCYYFDSVKGSSFTGNLSSGGVPQFGMILENCVSCVCSGNVMGSEGDVAFEIENSAYIAITSNDAVFEGFWNYGIRVLNSNRCSITGNTSRGDFHDIYLDSGSSYNSVVSNIATVSGITDNGTSNVVANNVT